MDLDSIVVAGYVVFLLMALILVQFVSSCCCDEDDDLAHQPAVSAEQRVVEVEQPAPAVESAEQRLARAWAEWQASVEVIFEAAAAARAEAALMRQAAVSPVPLPLPYFQYAAHQGDKPAETVECVICLEPLRPGQLCSEVLVCCHVFHGDCLGEWVRSNGSCPLCRAKIVPGSEEVAIADDMV